MSYFVIVKQLMVKFNRFKYLVEHEVLCSSVVKSFCPILIPRAKICIHHLCQKFHIDIIIFSMVPPENEPVNKTLSMQMVFTVRI